MTGVLPALFTGNYNQPYSPTVSAVFTQLTNATTPSWIDNSGTTGNRMITDSTGVVTYAPANMLLRSEDFSATWTLTNVTQTGGQSDPNGGTSATTLTASAGNGTAKQGVTTLARTYIYSVWLKRKTGTGNIDITADGTTWVTQTITSSWARYSVAQTGVAGTSNPGIRIVTNGDAVDAFGAQLESVTYQTSPGTYIKTTTAAVYQVRYDYDGSVSPATSKGILIEESRANLCIYSQTPSDASWTVTAATKTSTNNDDPFGTTTALLVTATSPTTAHFFSAGGTSVSYTSGTSYTASIYVKAGNTSLVQFTFNTSAFGSGQYANFSLSGSGSVTASSGGTAAITQVSSSWYRISFTASATATTSTAAGVLVFISSGTDARLPSIAGNQTLYVAGWQVEAGAFPSSYIHTPANASVTRVADIVKLSGTALTVATAATGSALVQTTLWQNSTAAARDLLSSATTRRLLYSNSSNTVVSSTDGTTRLDATIGGSATFTANVVRSAVAWNASGRSLVANNGTLASDSVNLSTGATATLGGYGTTTTFNGWVGSMALYDQKLPNSILSQKSTARTVY